MIAASPTVVFPDNLPDNAVVGGTTLFLRDTTGDENERGSQADTNLPPNVQENHEMKAAQRVSQYT
jgi:hypothetical protein